MSTLQIVFLVVAASLMLFWLILAVRGPRKLDVPNVIAVLRYGPVLRTLALVLALLPIMVMAYVVAVFRWKTDMMLVYAGSSFVGACLIAGLSLIEVSRGQVCVTEDGVTRASPWKGLVTLKWTEIERVQYSPLNSVFVVIGAGQRMRVSRYLVGVNAFAETVKRKLGPERYANAAVALNDAR